MSSRHATLVLLLAAASMALLFCLASGATASGAYPARFEQIDVDSVLGNKRILGNHIKCYLGTGPCTPDGSDIKKILPDLIATSCAKCSPKLKTNLRKVVNTMRTQHKADWELVINKYDPKKMHAKQLDAFLAANN